MLTKKKILHLITQKYNSEPVAQSQLKGGSVMGQIQYISDEQNNITGVIVPIELWREIESEKETAYLLKSKKMKKRLLEAKDHKEGIPFDKACEKLGI